MFFFNFVFGHDSFDHLQLSAFEKGRNFIVIDTKNSPVPVNPERGYYDEYLLLPFIIPIILILFMLLYISVCRHFGPDSGIVCLSEINSFVSF